MSVDTWSSGVQTLSWSLSNVDSRCAEACPATNCCGVHIHVGKTCSVAADIGGHYYDSTTYTTDPWLTVMYNATDSPSNTLSLPVTTGLTASDILGRAMVIHDFEGGRIACGIIKEATVSSFSAYPGYTGNLMSVGSALIDSGFGKQTLSWIFQSGLDTRCSEACMAPNCCGVHIHVGFDCTDTSTIGGHWWNSDALEADPWQTIMYNTTGGMPSVASSIEVDTQLSTVQINKRALVIHDFTGARIACGNIMMPVSEAIVSSFSLYPGSSSSLTVEGVMSVISSEDASGTQTLSWSLTGLDPACANTCTVPNCCGAHIHVGTDCSDASTIGGHYWDSSDYTTDPWQTVMYNSSSLGSNAASVAVATGLGASDVLGRAMVIHDSTGARIACGIIQLANVPSFAAYPGYTGNLATAGVMSVQATGTTQTLSWVLTAGLDTQCTGTCTAPNCCGVHIHTGMDCSDANVPSFASYPGYTGNLATAGVMSVQATGTTQTLSWVLTAGLDTQCTGTCTAPNCCGVHIHTGMDCSDSSTIGGHFYDSTALTTDPWLTITYDASTMPSVMKDVAVQSGKTASEIEGRTMVIHDSTGARIACGTISLDVMTPTTTQLIDIDAAAGPAVWSIAFLVALIIRW